MTVSTRLAPQWSARVLVLCAMGIAFPAWGTYDLFVKIPREEAALVRFNDLTRRLAALQERIPAGQPVAQLPPEVQAEAEVLARELASFRGETPTGPARYDRLVCWLFISCLPMAPYFLWQYLGARRRAYGLEEDGTLVSPAGRWRSDEIAGIDMRRWMSKSLAWVEHRDGRRVKLDDHIHRGTHLIVGSIAHRFHPEQWRPDARRATAAGEGESTSGTAAGETAAAAGPTRE
jgi:hypothetical protein